MGRDMQPRLHDYHEEVETESVLALLGKRSKVVGTVTVGGAVRRSRGCFKE